MKPTPEDDKSHPPIKRIGQRELARRLGVSQSTVSGVLNNSPSIRVAEKTRQRILEAIKDSHYQPNLIANAIFDRPTRTVGIIYQGGYIQLGMQKLAAIVERVLQRGYFPLIFDLLLGMTGEEQCQLLCDMKAAGAIIINSDYPFMYDIFPKALKGRLPVVSIDSPVDPGIPQIFTDKRQGFRILTDHLISKGHRKIALLTNRAPDIAAASPYTQAYSIIHGVNDSLSNAGLELAGVEYSQTTGKVGFNSDPYQCGAVALAKLLDKGCRPDAVICASDTWAIGALRECRRRRIRIPEELAIVGFNDELQAEYAACPLTTVAPPVDELADAALEVIIGPDTPGNRSATGPKAPRIVETRQDVQHPPLVLPCHLVIRESCGSC